MFGKTYAWLVDHTWSEKVYARAEIATNEEGFDGHRDLYRLDELQDKHVQAAWR